MKFAFVVLCVLTALITSSCGAPPMVEELSSQAAQSQAQKDFAAGTPRIYLAGGIAVFEPGIAENEKALVAKLPRNGRLAGCTNPNVKYSIAYATAYNREIISLLRKSRGQ